MRKFGLIGRNISYSFSESYFQNKFKEEEIRDASYQNFDLKFLKEFDSLLKNNPGFKGLNVTIPYKEEVIIYLDSVNKTAKQIGAVNTIKVTKKGKLKGYNTDYYGFKKSIKPFLKKHHEKALILGTGGASKAIAFVFEQLKIDYSYVSRSQSKNNFTYKDLNEDIVNQHTIIVNCSPVGTHPDVVKCPKIPYQAITNKHILFDLIYNPSETLFLKKGKMKGATIINGLKMLEYQAERSWEIWNK